MPLSATSDPLALPEIRSIVGRFLDFPDILRCLRVCRSWRATFSPFVWDSVSLQKVDRPTVHALDQHSSLVKNLSYHLDVWNEYKSIHLENLSLLKIQCNWNSPPIVVSQYEHLRCLEVAGGVVDSRRYVFKPYHLHNLKDLKLRGMDIDPEDTAAFWELCTQLEALLMNNTDIPELPDSSVTFERLQKLGVYMRSNVSLEKQLDWISQCPNLRTLDWVANLVVPPSFVDDFVLRATEGHWRSLTELHLREFHPSDEQLAKLITSMHQARVLSILGCSFGPLSFNALRSHFSTLKGLNIGDSSISVGLVIPEIMASCPQLSTLVVGNVMSQDVIDGRPWVCKESMTSLFACFQITPDRDQDIHQRHVLERISELSNLEELSLIGDGYNPASNMMQLHLGKGLEKLASLRKLKKLDVHNYRQDLSAQEVEVRIMPIDLSQHQLYPGRHITNLLCLSDAPASG